jgi:adenylate cyclase
MSGDPEQEFFADGMTEDLITDLSKISGLLVIARNSVFTYKGAPINVPAVCRELGVRWALEGSVRKAGNRVRINAQLIDGATGGHLWAERFDRDLDDIFAVQDEVTAEIVAALKLKFSAAEAERMTRRGTANPQAYDRLLRARELIVEGGPGALLEARGVIQRGLDADPEYAAAMAGMAMTYVGQYANQWGDDHRAALGQAIDWAERAFAADPDDNTALLALAVLRIWQRRLDDARVAAERMVELSPGSMDGCRVLGNIENYAGNPRRGAELTEQTMRLDPHYPGLTLHVLGQCYFGLKQFERAAEMFRQRIARNPNTDSSHAFLAATYGLLGRAEAAREQWAHVFEVNPDYSLLEPARLWPYEKTDVVDMLYAGLEKAGVDPGPKP